MGTKKLRMLSCLTALLLLLGVFGHLSSAIDVDEIDAKLIIHKMMYKEAKPSIENTGKELTIDEATATPYDRAKYGDVAFSVYDISHVTNRSKENIAALVAEISEKGVEADVLKQGGLVAGDVAVNDAGIASVEGGFAYEKLFAVLETKSAEGYVVAKADPIILQTPVYENPGLSEDELTEIHIYPKNQVTEMDFILKKYGDLGEPALLPGAKFQLYKGEPGSGTALGEPQVTDEFGKITIANITPGKYYFVELATEMVTEGAGGEYLLGADARNDAFNKLAFEIPATGVSPESLEIAYTNYGVPTVEKKVTGREEDVIGGAYEPGDKVPFTASVTIPKDILGGKSGITNMGETVETAPYKIFRYTDTPGEGLVYNNAENLPAELVVGTDAVTLVKDVDYTVKSLDGRTFEVNFIRENGKVTEKVGSLAGETLKITYALFIAPNATPETEIKNSAKIIFSNNPNVEGDGDEVTNSDEVSLKLYGKKFLKTDSGAFGTGILDKPLAGAEFIIEKRDSQGTIYYYVGEPTALADGTFTSQWSEDIASAKKIISGEDGTFEVTGLRAGKYLLRETKAPEGYALKPPYDFIVEEGSYEGDAMKITNDKLPEMPMTGSEKLLIFGGIGLLVTMGAIFMVLKKKHTAFEA